MKVEELVRRCLGGHYTTMSVERPIKPGVQNEVLYRGKVELHLIPDEILEMKISLFSVNLPGAKRKLEADIVFYVE